MLKLLEDDITSRLKQKKKKRLYIFGNPKMLRIPKIINLEHIDEHDLI